MAGLSAFQSLAPRASQTLQDSRERYVESVAAAVGLPIRGLQDIAVALEQPSFLPSSAHIVTVHDHVSGSWTRYVLQHGETLVASPLRGHGDLQEAMKTIAFAVDRRNMVEWIRFWGEYGAPIGPIERLIASEDDLRFNLPEGDFRREEAYRLFSAPVITEREGGFLVVLDAVIDGGLWWVRIKVADNLSVTPLDRKPLLPEAGLAA